MSDVLSKTLREIGLQLVKEIANERNDSEEDSTVPSDELLLALHVAFPQTLQQALDLVDRNSVTKVVSASGRELFQVKGSSGRIYTCLMTSEFCTCPSYTYYVLMKEEVLMCKHVLAVYVAQNLQNLNERSVSDDDFAKILTEVND